MITEEEAANGITEDDYKEFFDNIKNPATNKKSIDETIKDLSAKGYIEKYDVANELGISLQRLTRRLKYIKLVEKDNLDEKDVSFYTHIESHDVDYPKVEHNYFIKLPSYFYKKYSSFLQDKSEKSEYSSFYINVFNLPNLCTVEELHSISDNYFLARKEKSVVSIDDIKAKCDPSLSKVVDTLKEIRVFREKKSDGGIYILTRLNANNFVYDKLGDISLKEVGEFIKNGDTYVSCVAKN